MSRLFDSNGKIGNWFPKALGTRPDGSVLRWSGRNGGEFTQGSIFDNGTNVGIGTANPLVSLHVATDYSADGSTSRAVASFDRTYSNGVGAVGIGAHLPLRVESSTV